MDSKDESQLKPAEIKILELAAQGLTNKEIARKMSLSQRTIEHILANSADPRAIYPKIGVKNKAEAVAWYIAKFGAPSEAAVADKVFTDLLLEQFTDFSSKILQVRREGEPQLAIKIADLSSARLEELAQAAPTSIYRHNLLHILGQVLNQQVWAYKEILQAEELLPVVRPILDKITNIAREIGDKELFGSIEFNLGDAYYIVGAYDSAVRRISHASDFLKDQDELLMLLRTLALDLAYLEEPEGFKKIEAHARHRIEEGKFSNLEMVTTTLEGLARGRALLFKDDRAFQILEKSSDAYAQMREANQRAPIREVQIMRSGVEILRVLDPTAKQLLEEVGTKGLILAQAENHSYYRHARIIKNILRGTLN